MTICILLTSNKITDSNKSYTSYVDMYYVTFS